MDGPVNHDGRWRLTKDISITTVGFIFLQTVLFTWFLAGQNAKLTAVASDNEQDKATRYTKDDARHEREFMEQKFLLIQNKEDELTRRVTLVEGRIAVTDRRP